ncbi:DUF6612 family protein [Aeromicrobium sp. 9AM]|uniref:DUF6612 family protein n=1 Tax=Aeromicrobium sp. 9AM TaxID=2653126 RepID=UPI0012F0BF63|nr:DUF6612 family protein [Aeromicrobium sp. 9AM]VXA95771.1 conserved exported hypothetical protein [Aeromicrobium sp. 9AM]
MTISRKLTSFVAVAVVAGLSLSACGDKDDSAADKKTGSSGGGKSVTLTQANFSDVLTDSQAKAKSSHVDMSIGVGGQTVKAQGDVKVGSSIKDVSMAMTMTMDSREMEMRLVDQTFYMNMGQITDDKFVKIDLTDESNPIAKQYSRIMDQMDPASQLRQFKAAVKSFEKKGEPQTIDGVKAQPYVVTVDTSKLDAIKDLPAASRSQVPKTIVYTMYVGSDDLLRRMEFELAGAKTTMDYSKWGEPVDVQAPSPDEISDKDISELSGAPAAA